MHFLKKTAAPTWLVAGLGNPGKQYENTRHNVGFDALDVLANNLNTSVKRARFSALYGSTAFSQQCIALLKPQTFMNLSGQSIAKAAQFYKIPAENIIVLCDDVNLAPGVLRIRLLGSDGGHNGLKSIIASVGQNFVRIRIGVGEKPCPEYDMSAWVMARPAEKENKLIKCRYDDISRAVKLIICGDASEAMCKYNSKQN